MSKSYWKYWYLGPNGEWICVELFAELYPGLTDDNLGSQLKTLGRLQELAVELPEAVQVVEAVDAYAERLNKRLPENAALRRMADEEFPLVGVPDVIGLSHIEAAHTLWGAGYQVKTVWEWTSSTAEDHVSDQSPRGGAGNLPPTLVHIWVHTLPPEVEIPELPTPIFE